MLNTHEETIQEMQVVTAAQRAKSSLILVNFWKDTQLTGRQNYSFLESFHEFCNTMMMISMANCPLLYLTPSNK